MKVNGKANGSLSDDTLLTSKELAKWLKVSEAWVRDHVSGRRNPQLPYLRLGDQRGQIRFRLGDIREFLKANMHNGA
jgi:hypothetical protein